MELAVAQLQCHKGNSEIFSNLTFSVRARELLLIQGANGSGKSTLLRLLAGLTTPTKGKIYFNRKLIANQMTGYRSQIGYVGHQAGIHLSLTPAENWSLACAMERPEHRQDHEMLKVNLQLSALFDTPCQRLSAGQRRKVALGMLILKDKPIWLLDEPLTALDANSVAVFSKYLERHIELGGIGIMATHVIPDFPKPHTLLAL